MSDLDSTLYDFVFYVAAILLLAWALRILVSYKQMHSLAMAVNAGSIVLLQELLTSGERVTTDSVTALLQRKKRLIELPVTACSLAACTGKVKLESRDGSDVLKLEICCRLPTAVDVFVSVPHSALQPLQGKGERGDGVTRGRWRRSRRRVSRQQISPKRPVRSSLSSSSSSFSSSACFPHRARLRASRGSGAAAHSIVHSVIQPAERDPAEGHAGR